MQCIIVVKSYEGQVADCLAQVVLDGEQGPVLGPEVAEDEISLLGIPLLDVHV